MIICPVYNLKCICADCRGGKCSSLKANGSAVIVNQEINMSITRNYGHPNHKPKFKAKKKYITIIQHGRKYSGPSIPIMGDRSKCWYCDDPIKSGKETRDHFYPKRLKGKVKVWCCRHCNGDKGAMLPNNWIFYMAQYPDRFPQERIAAAKALWEEIRIHV